MIDAFAARRRARPPLYLPYLAISAAALGIDSASFLLLLRLGTPPLAAAACGYALGAVAHWLLSTRTIFAGRTAGGGLALRRQQALYLGSGLLGFAVTALVMSGALALGADPRIAKLAAIAASFNAVYAMRRYLVFRGAPRGA